MANAEGYRVNIEDNDDLGGDFTTKLVATSMLGNVQAVHFQGEGRHAHDCGRLDRESLGSG